MEKLARAGYATHGLVHILIGALAAQAALAGAKPSDAQGALVAVGKQPFGVGLLFVAAAGLAAHSLWMAVLAGFDPEREGSGAGALIKRAGYALGSIGHAGLAFLAFELAMGVRQLHRGSSPRVWTARAFKQPGGRWIVLIVGVIVIAAAIGQLVVAAQARFRAELEARKMSPREKSWATGLGRVGYVARGAVFGVIGWYLSRAALDKNAKEAHGMYGALRVLQHQKSGRILLGSVAVGLICYGLFCLLFRARYRRIGKPPPSQRRARAPVARR